MTAIVCQPDKLVAAISPTGVKIPLHWLIKDLGEGSRCQIENCGCLLARDWQDQNRTIFLWQQDIGACATLAKGSSLPRVRSGELVLTTRCDQTHVSLRPIVGCAEGSCVGPPSRLHLDECRTFSPASSFGAFVMETARMVGVEARTLAVRALLQLPRVASYKGWVTRSQVQRELRISAEALRSDERRARSHMPGERFPLRDLLFEEIGPSRALPALNVAPLSSERSSALDLLRAGRSNLQASG